MQAKSSSTTERVLVRLASAAGGVVICAAVLAAASGEAPGITPDTAQLPDLDQELPWDLRVTSVGPSNARRHRLGFASAVANVGDGPLIVSGRRERPADTMTADQLIERFGAPMAVVEGVGRLRYVRSRDHQHWHLLDFERYELRGAGSSRRVMDRKTGFCLGDRYRTRHRALPAAPPLASGHAAHPCAPPLSRHGAMPAEIDPDRRKIVKFQKRLFVAVLASLMIVSATPAQAKQILGTQGPDKLVGTAKADVIKGLRGKDRISGRRGGDRLFGGRGADRLNAVDGRRDRLVRGGPGKDVCRIDPADRGRLRGCEIVKVVTGGGPGGGPGGPLVCASPPGEARFAPGRGGRAAQEDAPPTFSDPFYALTITINASVDGVNGDELPVSIEEVCDVPSGLAGEAAQLIGGEGVALITSATKVFDASGQELSGDAAATALAGADSVSLKAQLMRPAQWRQDEDGQPVPTFRTSRADITD
jgi:RTX calcium-binding nonapeptide repeat (4 copies)